ncbi:MAG: YifB family Mg chelatase-like AAA ATPase [Rhodospirillales bacterium]|nr:YifB family Mg chelatase-like AAA ATPase [Rhodospirillales bacterium]
MIAHCQSFAFSGIDAVPVDVQVQLASGLPAFLLVGLAERAVNEARERVRAALASMGLSLPPRRVLINLAPADIVKEGSHFDVPIALALLAAMDVIPAGALDGVAALGELSLDGRLLAVNGVLPAAIAASGAGQNLICPASQSREAAWASGLQIHPADTLLELINFFRGAAPLPLPDPAELDASGPGNERMLDLADVRGMELARRGLEIAAAGEHNLLMIGPPGSGKSMLAARMPALLPDLSPIEALEVSMVHSVAGMLKNGRLLRRPPYREPHHGASQAALVGGGQRARPGEMSLAHCGVLFLDELPEFPRHALEALRQPMETGRATIARAAAHVTYPARFQLVAAMNPCRCGYLDDAGKACTRAPRCGETYQSRISGPILDRIDLVVHVAPVSPAELARAPRGESSSTVARRVAAARQRRRDRTESENKPRSGDGYDAAICLSPEAGDLAEKAMERLGLSPRSYTRLIRVARTIADLAAATEVAREHVAEALMFRHRPLRGAGGY